MILFSILLEDNACIVATETEGIAQCSTHLALLCLIECEIHLVVYLRIIIAFLVVDGRRHDVGLHRLDTSQSLYGTSRTEKVTVILFVEEMFKR